MADRLGLHNRHGGGSAARHFADSSGQCFIFPKAGSVLTMKVVLHKFLNVHKAMEGLMNYL